MSAEDREAQEDELLALHNIYAEDEFQRAMYAQGGQIRACLKLPHGFRIFVSDNDANNPLKGDFEVCFLPPVLLTFELPEDYPSTSAPVFVLSCKWLLPVQVSSLCKQLDNLWEENKGCVVLFAWMQFLKEETLQYLNIVSPLEVTVDTVGMHSQKTLMQMKEEQDICDATAMPKRELLDGRAMQDVESLASLIRDLLDFDQTQQLRRFHSKPYLCSICFLEKLGSECTQFKACQHVYCNVCLKAYFEIQIKEGQVHLLSCPEPKCASVSTPAQVKALVGDQLFSRYDRLLLQSSLDSMSDVVYCPRQKCQTPVMKEPEGTMGICSNCRYVFCDLCKMTYHGVAPCAQLEDEDQTSAATSGACASSPSYKEKKYKKWQEKANKKYLANNTKKCPQCAVHIQKNGGCNRMFCTNCLLEFCWNCALPFTSNNIPNNSRNPSQSAFAVRPTFTEEELLHC